MIECASNVLRRWTRLCGINEVKVFVIIVSEVSVFLATWPYAGVERRITYGNYSVEGSNGLPSRPANPYFRISTWPHNRSRLRRMTTCVMTITHINIFPLDCRTKFPS